MTENFFNIQTISEVFKNCLASRSYLRITICYNLKCGGLVGWGGVGCGKYDESQLRKKPGPTLRRSAVTRLSDVGLVIRHTLHSHLQPNPESVFPSS
jgi:hypothetical protein